MRRKVKYKIQVMKSKGKEEYWIEFHSPECANDFDTKGCFCYITDRQQAVQLRDKLNKVLSYPQKSGTSE